MADKLNMQTPNRANENFEKLAALFPNAVTEAIDENGEVVRAIDKDVLMQEISCKVVEGREERYQFTWPNKKKAILLANAPISETLRPCREESVGRDGTPGGFDSENLYIEGDNLDVLKLLQETYLGKIKMIYIDPPYNTGNDFVYEDDFSESAEEYLAKSGQFDEQGNRLFPNTESNGRFHTDWLNMIYPRLRLAKDLLAPDGSFFISIDDHEVDNLKKICDEIFGAASFVANVSWQRTYSMRNDAKCIPAEVEHILVFSKEPEWQPHKLERTESMDSKYKNPDNDHKGPWRNIVASAPGASTHQGMVYAIQNPVTGEFVYPPKGRCWSLGQDQMLDAMQKWCNYTLVDLKDYEARANVCNVSTESVKKDVFAIVLSDSIDVSKRKAEAIYKYGVLPEFFFSKEGHGTLSRKAYLEQMGGRPVTNLWPFEETGHTDEASRALKTMFNGDTVFDTPKPVRLMERMLTIASDKDSIILDFFSGSASMAHAVIKKNAEDGGKRKFIMVQIPERISSPDFATLCDVGKERIRRAGQKIKNEWQIGEGFDQLSLESAHFKDDIMKAGESAVKDLDIGFRVLKLDSSNMKNVYYNPAEYTPSMFETLTDNIKEDRTPEDLLFQVMLDLGVLLSNKIEETTIGGKKVFSVADGFLMACFDSDVTDDVITEIAKKKPYYFVTRDHSMASDSVATNFEQIFQTYSPATVRKVL